MITFTLDLEDHRSNQKNEKRYPDITRRVLAVLEKSSSKGTFFVVGTVAKEEPGLIKEIVKEGHEIAFHSYSHTQLQHENPKNFKQETESGKHFLEDLTGQEIIGYRAPVFSLTKQTVWTLDILNELGFVYSSSVLPTSNPLNGFPDTPKTPFYWSNGLLEIPVPVAQIGPFTIPYLGGVYLRYLPIALIKKLVKINKEQQLWTYCHPYDFDPNEPFFRIKGASFLTSLILWFNRSKTEEKISFLLSLNSDRYKGTSFFNQYKRGIYKELPIFEI